MAKEYTKFKSDFDKKIAANLKTLNTAEMKHLSERMRMAFAAAWEGENVLKEGLVPAHQAGITGTNLADYLKNKDFKEAYTLYKKAAEEHAKLLNEAADSEKEAKKTLSVAMKLDADITKDLKKRKDNSDSKKDIVALQKDVQGAIKELALAAKVYDRQDKHKKNYASNFAKTVQSILKTPPDQAKQAKDNTEMPQLFVDRVLGRNTKSFTKHYKTALAKVDEALKVSETDLKAASVPMKAAVVELSALKKINDDYIDALNNNTVKRALDDSKDKAAILKKVTSMNSAYTAAEKKVRGAATVLKKASV